MSLIHDPSAIRYASTQEAYGFTWTLDKIEPDGAQVWKNSKGHEAIVQKAAATVSRGKPVLEIKFDGTENLTVLPTAPVWKLMDIGQTEHQLDNMVRKPISDDRLKKTVTVTNVIPDSCYLADYSELDVQIGQRLMEKGFFVDWHKAEKACTSGRVSSTEPNQSNPPKAEQKYGYYSAQAEAAGVGVVQYLTLQGTLVAVTCADTGGTAWPDEICLGPVTKYVKTISGSTWGRILSIRFGYKGY